ncbi:hypothetical protein [Halobellus marinus]|jgi:hypothetical protein|uniref:hypothetical protein n=1 Tax=Halobellus TaxID=1073986 RepID=UPI0028B0B2A4|nr:hypothetical protein [Halobellus sp. DFY28]
MTSDSAFTPKHEVRAAVTEQNQIHLPESIVERVTFVEKGLLPKVGGLVSWYYHTDRDKAVLASDTVDTESITLVDTCTIVGVSNEDVDSGDIGSGRVTISSELPDELSQRLRSADEVVLKPSYVERSGSVTWFISVYPAEEYDRGEAADVTREQVREEKSDSTAGEQTVVGSKYEFVNII